MQNVFCIVIKICIFPIVLTYAKYIVKFESILIKIRYVLVEHSILYTHI